jgi:hypothetical protein
MFVPLPSDATTISRQRAQMMAELVRDCPPELGQEIYLYCSVAKGYADQYSDIEVTFLVDKVAEPIAYENWLRSVGAQVDPVTFAWGGGYTTKSWLNGVFIEAAWRPMDALNAIVEKVSQAATTDHWRLVDAWHLVHAVPLRAGPQLSAWQKRLSFYPEELVPKLIADATRHLAEPHWYPLSLITAFPLALRDVPMLLSGELTWAIERTLRILFAFNRQWEPDYKWLKYEDRRLASKPADLVARVNNVFMLPNLRDRVQTCLQLLLETLTLLSPEFDVAKEIEHVQAALEPEKLIVQRDGK